MNAEFLSTVVVVNRSSVATRLASSSTVGDERELSVEYHASFSASPGKCDSLEGLPLSQLLHCKI